LRGSWDELGGGDKKLKRLREWRVRVKKGLLEVTSQTSARAALDYQEGDYKLSLREKTCHSRTVVRGLFRLADSGGTPLFYASTVEWLDDNPPAEWEMLSHRTRPSLVVKLQDNLRRLTPKRMEARLLADSPEKADILSRRQIRTKQQKMRQAGLDMPLHSPSGRRKFIDVEKLQIFHDRHRQSVLKWALDSVPGDQCGKRIYLACPRALVDLRKRGLVKCQGPKGPCLIDSTYEPTNGFYVTNLFFLDTLYQTVKNGTAFASSAVMVVHDRLTAEFYQEFAEVIHSALGGNSTISQPLVCVGTDSDAALLLGLGRSALFSKALSTFLCGIHLQRNFEKQLHLKPCLRTKHHQLKSGVFGAEIDKGNRRDRIKGLVDCEDFEWDDNYAAWRSGVEFLGEEWQGQGLDGAVAAIAELLQYFESHMAGRIKNGYLLDSRRVYNTLLGGLESAASSTNALEAFHSQIHFLLRFRPPLHECLQAMMDLLVDGVLQKELALFSASDAIQLAAKHACYRKTQLEAANMSQGEKDDWIEKLWPREPGSASATSVWVQKGSILPTRPSDFEHPSLTAKQKLTLWDETGETLEHGEMGRMGDGSFFFVTGPHDPEPVSVRIEPTAELRYKCRQKNCALFLASSGTVCRHCLAVAFKEGPESFKDYLGASVAYIIRHRGLRLGSEWNVAGGSKKVHETFDSTAVTGRAAAPITGDHAATFDLDYRHQFCVCRGHGFQPPSDVQKLTFKQLDPADVPLTHSHITRHPWTIGLAPHFGAKLKKKDRKCPACLWPLLSPNEEMPFDLFVSHQVSCIPFRGLSKAPTLCFRSPS
jgi:hypothetical protein